MRASLGLRLALVAGLACLAGCGGADDAGPPRLSVHPVEGRILIGGSPTANVHIGFVPLAGGIFRPVAVSGADGTFRLMTYAAGDGAPAGEYAVTVLWINDSIPRDECGDPALHDRFNGYYLDPAARRLLATVQPGSNTITLNVPLPSGGWSLPRQSPAGSR